MVDVGDVVQISPDKDSVFGGCFLLVTEVKSWGVQGFVQIPNKGEAYYRASHDRVERIGKAVWVPKESTDEQGHGDGAGD